VLAKHPANWRKTSLDNIYLPKSAVIKEVIGENEQIKTFVTAFRDEMSNRSFTYEPGQFMMVSIPGFGEAPISISSTPTRPGTLELSVRRAGKLTDAMHKLQAGDSIGLRGPYGRPFPLDIIGNDLLFVAGGIGLAPLRSVINYCLDQSGTHGKKVILYGSRLPSDIAFQRDIAEWQQRSGVTCILTVDQAETGWTGPVGLVTSLFDGLDLNSEKSVALVCGPPVMIPPVLRQLKKMGFADENIWTTMERYMKCGVGICGHCHMEGKLICVDGPVFNKRELDSMKPLS
jgi:NAD(P)H-flavin reductase